MGIDRFDLLACRDGSFCFACDLDYVDGRTPCPECGRPTTSTAALRRELGEHGAPGSSHDGDPRFLVELLRSSQDDELEPALAVLRENEAAFVVIPLEPPPLRRILVDERDLDWLRSDIGLPDDDTLELLATAGNDVEAMDIRDRLDAAGIRYEESQFSQQYGMLPGVLSERQFHVLGHELESAKRALADPAPDLPTDEVDDPGWRAELTVQRIERRYWIARVLVGILVLSNGLIFFSALSAGHGAAAISAGFFSAGFLWALVTSFSSPKEAFSAGFVLSVMAAVFGFTVQPFVAVPGVITFFATYWAAHAEEAEKIVAGAEVKPAR